MLKIVKRLWKEESGQGMAEYGLILALVAIAAIAAFKGLGTSITSKVTDTGTQLQNANPATGN